MNVHLALLAGDLTLRFLALSALNARLSAIRCTAQTGYDAWSAHLGTNPTIGMVWKISAALRAASEVLALSVHGEWNVLRAPLDQSQTLVGKAVNSVEELLETATALGRQATCIVQLVRSA